MFDIDLWQEIGAAIRTNKLRTFLTGFSVAWGIFMLIILLSAGNGLKNGFSSRFGSRGKNTVEVWGGRISIPHNGLPMGRRVSLEEKDLEMVKTKYNNASNFGAELWVNATASNKSEYSSVGVVGVYPIAQSVANLEMPQGRFINDMDLQQKRKVVIIGKQVQNTLFKKTEPIGQYIKISDAMFKVVGIYERTQNWGNDNQVYIPFSTHKAMYAAQFNRNGLNSMMFVIDGLNSKEENEYFDNDLRKKLALTHRFHPEDKRAVGIWNQMENYLQTMSIFNGISLFMWIIGIGTLLAGVVGVSNIMLITVRERTREFGIRKALGAKPLSILQLILLESISITALFGYVGMVAGIGITEVISMLMGGGSGIFTNPTIDLNIALMSTGVLVIAGVLAGYFPARRAIKITAVEAMRSE